MIDINCGITHSVLDLQEKVKAGGRDLGGISKHMIWKGVKVNDITQEIE